MKTSKFDQIKLSHFFTLTVYFNNISDNVHPTSDVSAGLKCYVCSSALSDGCGETFTEDDDVPEMDCSLGKCAVSHSSFFSYILKMYTSTLCLYVYILYIFIYTL